MVECLPGRLEHSRSHRTAGDPPERFWVTFRLPSPEQTMASPTPHVLEQKNVLGGAVRTEYPFAKVPKLGISSGAYLLGLMPPELMQKLGLNLTLKRRDPHYFLPTLDGRYLLFGSDEAEMKRQFLQ